MPPLTRVLRAAAFAAAGCAAVAPATAQSRNPGPTTTLTWRLENVHRAYCISFLASPDRVRDLLGNAYRPKPEGAPAHPVVARFVESDRSFAGWAPSELCIWDAERVVADGESFDGKGKGVTVGWLAVAAHQVNGKPGRPVDVFTTDGALRRSELGRRIDAGELEMIFGRTIEDTGDLWTIKLGRTSLFWEGRLASDTTAATPIDREWMLTPGLRDRFTIKVHAMPEVQRSMVGGVSVPVKGRIARAFRTSPIRFAGPLYTGGPVDISVEF